MRYDKCVFNYEYYKWIFEKMTLKVKLFIMNLVFFVEGFWNTLRSRCSLFSLCRCFPLLYLKSAESFSFIKLLQLIVNKLECLDLTQNNSVEKYWKKAILKRFGSWVKEALDMLSWPLNLRPLIIFTPSNAYLWRNAWRTHILSAIYLRKPKPCVAWTIQTL